MPTKLNTKDPRNKTSLENTTQPIQWSRNVPTTPGFYWWRESKSKKPEIVKVSEVGSGAVFWVYGIGNALYQNDAHLHIECSEWYGPIEAPEMPD